MNKFNFYLDDIRETPFGFHVRAYTYDECIWLLLKLRGCIGTLSLDHDLGDFAGLYDPDRLITYGASFEGEKTGYDVLCWLEEEHLTKGFPLPEKILIHSDNPIGRQRMQQVIRKLYGNYSI